MTKTIACAVLLLASQIGSIQAQEPQLSSVVSLDSEHGVTMRLIQELDALKALAEEGKATQRSGNDLVLIDFDELVNAFEFIRAELERAMARKYGHATSGNNKELF